LLLHKVLNAFENDDVKLISLLETVTLKQINTMTLKDWVVWFCSFKNHEHFYRPEEICSLGEYFTDESGYINNETATTQLTAFVAKNKLKKDSSDRKHFLGEFIKNYELPNEEEK